MMAPNRRFRCDDETGEVVNYDINEETGEPSTENSSTFVYTSAAERPRFKKTKRHVRFRKGYSTDLKKYQTLQDNIMAGSNVISYRLLLIPVTIMFFPALLCGLMMLEIYLHVRCHKKNKNLTNVNLYYRSPFHVVTSTFCGACRETELACRISQLQDRRRNRYDYLRGLAI